MMLRKQLVPETVPLLGVQDSQPSVDQITLHLFLNFMTLIFPVLPMETSMVTFTTHKTKQNHPTIVLIPSTGGGFPLTAFHLHCQPD
jgi:hypothetical protein